MRNPYISPKNHVDIFLGEKIPKNPIREHQLNTMSTCTLGVHPSLSLENRQRFGGRLVWTVSPKDLSTQGRLLLTEKFPDPKFYTENPNKSLIKSMNGMFTYGWLIFMVSVGRYTIHGWSGNEYWEWWALEKGPTPLKYADVSVSICRISGVAMFPII